MEAIEVDFNHTPRMRTPFVMALVMLAVFTFSFLATFAIPQALVNSNVIRAWPAAHDPRPRWLIIAFGSIMVAVVLFGVVCRQLSSRQLRIIDSMTDADEAQTDE